MFDRILFCFTLDFELDCLPNSVLGICFCLTKKNLSFHDGLTYDLIRIIHLK